MPSFRLWTLAALLCVASFAHAATDNGAEAQVRAADTRFWQAYNACDLDAMGDLVSQDVEFYHDKGGLTVSRQGLVDSIRKGLCANPDMRLRREAVEGSLNFHPLAGGYAILSGKHRFYVREKGKPEYLDGQAAFTTVWQLRDGQWRMHRVLSYDHGPATYTPPASSFQLAPGQLDAYAGRYVSARIGDIRVAVDGGQLRLTAGSFSTVLSPLSKTEFFARERDIRFDFDLDAQGRARALKVREHGQVTDQAERAD